MDGIPKAKEETAMEETKITLTPLEADEDLKDTEMPAASASWICPWEKPTAASSCPCVSRAIASPAVTDSSGISSARW